mmetsp:Transcript_97149/g.299426  ORF Transcript_97149/g.299426 Transcript_97149/m.299426 type:complete len:98 (-) Transcript_97149:561-854(-)
MCTCLLRRSSSHLSTSPKHALQGASALNVQQNCFNMSMALALCVLQGYAAVLCCHCRVSAAPKQHADNTCMTVFSGVVQWRLTMQGGSTGIDLRSPL